MATTKHEETPDRRNRVARYALAGLLLVAAAGVVLAYRSAPPQMGADEDVFNTVDALYTAVRNQDEKSLAECEQRLKDYRSADKLPPDAAEVLEGIIAKARSGSWQTAAERLYDFMKAQRRDGSTEPKPHKPQPKQKKGAK